MAAAVCEPLATASYSSVISEQETNNGPSIVITPPVQPAVALLQDNTRRRRGRSRDRPVVLDLHVHRPRPRSADPQPAMWAELMKARQLLRETDELMTQYGDRMTSLEEAQTVVPNMWSIHCVLTSFVNVADSLGHRLSERLLTEFSDYMTVVTPLVASASVVLVMCETKNNMEKLRHNMVRLQQPDLAAYDSRLKDIVTRQATLLARVRTASFLLLNLSDAITPSRDMPLTVTSTVAEDALSTRLYSVTDIIADVETDMSDLYKSVGQGRRMLEDLHGQFRHVARVSSMCYTALSASCVSLACLLAYRRHALFSAMLAACSLLPMLLNSALTPDDLSLMMLCVHGRYARLNDCQRYLDRANGEIRSLLTRKRPSPC